MIKGLYFGSNYSVTLAESEISWLNIAPPPQNSDEYYHEFVARHCKNDVLIGFVIEFSGAEKSKSALQLATHLRFSSLAQGITIVGRGISKEDFYSENPNSLLTTNLANFENLDDFETNEIPEIGSSINFQDVKDNIKNGSLIIPKPDNSSNHRIANEWGAFKLAHATNTLHIIKENTSVQEKEKTLYFKYLCLKENIDIIENSLPKTIDCQNKKVLLIDDQAEKGWEDILRLFYKLLILKFLQSLINLIVNSKTKKKYILMLKIR
jgi:hypothetical protein